MVLEDTTVVREVLQMHPRQLAREACRTRPICEVHLRLVEVISVADSRRQLVRGRLLLLFA